MIRFQPQSSASNSSNNHLNANIVMLQSKKPGSKMNHTTLALVAVIAAAALVIGTFASPAFADKSKTNKQAKATPKRICYFR